jgi:response regulator RpfG family c-di-GMP phosphodiesterase
VPVLLLIDDEVRVLSALRRALRKEGYDILTASTAEEAMAVVDARPVDLVLSDHKMPGMSGVQLLEAVAARRPDAARLLISGWPEEVPRERLAALDIRALIPKPWDDAELKAELRNALAPR